MEHEKNDTPQGQVTTEEQIDMIADHIGNLLDAPEPTKTDEGESTQPTEREVTEVKAGSEPPKAPADDMKADEKPAKEVTAERIKIKWEGEERELTKDELVELAQKGYDYTRKTQALAERERQLAPLEGIAKTVQSDPAFAAYLRDYFLQKGKPKTEEQPPPKFDDPIEELKYNLKKEIQEEYRKELSEKERAVAHQLVIQRVRNEVQRDPDFQDVTRLMIEHLKTLPEETGRLVFLQWDQNPDAYLKAFSHYKSVVQGLKAKTPPPAPATENTPDAKPPERRTEKAPLLESSGSGEPPDTVAERNKKISKMKAKALRSGDPMAIAEWLLESGSIDNLIQ